MRVMKSTLKSNEYPFGKNQGNAEKMVSQQDVHAKSITRGLSSSNVQIRANHPSMCSVTEVSNKEECALGLLRSNIKGSGDQLPYI